MTTVDLYGEDRWRELLTESHEQTGLTMILLDANAEVQLAVGERNALCARIRNHPEGLTQICSQTAAAMTAQVKATRGPVVERCEAGLLRLAVPVFHEGALLGQVAGCGRADDLAEVDPELLALQLQLDEAEIDHLKSSVELVKLESLEDYAKQLADRLIAVLRSAGGHDKDPPFGQGAHRP